MVTASPFRLPLLAFEITALVVYHVPRWFVTGMQIWIFEDRKGNWTFSRHLRVQVMRHLFGFSRRVGLPGPAWPDHTAVQGPGGIWIPAVPDDLIVGEIGVMARDRNISLISIPGYWIHKDTNIPLETPPFPGEKIFYHFHGGAYIAGSAHPDLGGIGRIVKDFLRNSSSPSLRRTFAVEYRLSKHGKPGKRSVHPFPAAFLDALAGYLYLIKLGFQEEDIIVVGDSAGANMALALTRYLIFHKGIQPKLPKVPGALVLLSPFTDASEQFLDNPDPRSSLIVNAERDWLEPIHVDHRRADAMAFLGGRPEDVELAYRNPYISPASRILLGLTPGSPTQTISFKGFPRTFIDNGRFDLLYDQVLRLAEAMVEELGKDLVTYNEVDGASHDYLFIDWFDPDRTDTSKKILKWAGL